jgi:hypothetical protein
MISGRASQPKISLSIKILDIKRLWPQQAMIGPTESADLAGVRVRLVEGAF